MQRVDSLQKTLMLGGIGGRRKRCLFWELPQWLSGKKSACNAGDLQESEVRSLGQEDPLEKEMATKSSILAWEIPWTKEAGGLQSVGSQKNLT